MFYFPPLYRKKPGHLQGPPMQATGYFSILHLCHFPLFLLRYLHVLLLYRDAAFTVHVLPSIALTVCFSFVSMLLITPFNGIISQITNVNIVHIVDITIAPDRLMPGAVMYFLPLCINPRHHELIVVTCVSFS